jgi:hypothetical protein
MAAFGPLLPPAGVQACGAQQVVASGENAIGLGATPPMAAYGPVLPQAGVQASGAQQAKVMSLAA